MLSPRPYLLRALYDWLVDSEAKPQIVVDAESDLVQVPREFVRNGQIVLNISPQAVRALYIGDDEIRFSARFGGVSREVRVPLGNVLGIFDGLSGQGMFLPPDAQFGVDEVDAAPAAARTQLRVVADDEQAGDAAGAPWPQPVVERGGDAGVDEPEQTPEPPPGVTMGPRLRRIK